MGSQITPSAAGKTTISFGAGTYAGEFGTALNLVHRINIATPVFISAGVAASEDGNWGGRIGIGMEF
jgi:hypothetical protein